VAVTHGAIQLTVVPRLCPPLAARMASGAVPWTLPNTAIALLEVSADGADGAGFACTTWGASADRPAQ
jgi:hypothetical protein